MFLFLFLAWFLRTFPLSTVGLGNWCGVSQIRFYPMVFFAGARLKNLLWYYAKYSNIPINVVLMT